MLVLASLNKWGRKKNGKTFRPVYYVVSSDRYWKL
jgi:hypothetical protein